MMNLEAMPDLLTAEQVGEYLGVSRSAVYSWFRTRKMPGTKYCGSWRIRKETFSKWMTEQEEANCALPE